MGDALDDPKPAASRQARAAGCGDEMLKTITVTNMPRASHLADGSMVEMEFAGSNGEKFALRFSPDKLESFVAQATQLLCSARSQKLKGNG
jgi:hypothetical protein